MRGIVRIPDFLGARRKGAARNGDAMVAGAPKPASRSQTDQVGFAQFAMSLGINRKSSSGRDNGLILPVNSDGQEDYLRQTYIGKGQHMARQDQWDVLGRLIRETDAGRDVTSEGVSLASLLSRGARTDFVNAAAHDMAINAEADRDLTDILDDALEDNADCWGVAVAVAQAQIEVGLASLSVKRLTSCPDRDNPRFVRHFDKAAEVLDPFSPIELNSAILAEARCELLPGMPDARSRVCDDFEDLIDLDPENPRHMRRYGLALLPRWFGSFELLAEMAASTAERVEDIWGEGGYTWVWFDVLRAVPESAELLDIERYLAGLDDILERRDTQHITNVIGAHAGVVMDKTSAPDDIPNRALANRARINARFGDIVANHLHELHARHWAEAQMSPFAKAPTNEELAEDGEAMARTLIARHYQDDLSAGRTVAFTVNGVELREPA